MKKKLLTAAVLTLCAVALVAGSVFATIAFLADFSAVSNTFTVGSVGIDMKESKVNIDGELDGDSKVDGNSYHLVPNKTYIKDPTITIDKTEAKDMMYLFVKSSNQIRGVEEGNLRDSNGDLIAENPAKTMRQQMESYGWVEFIQSGDGVEIIWVYGSRNPETGVITPTAVNCESKQNVLNAAGELVEGNLAKGEFRLCDNFRIGNVDSNKLGFYGGLTVTFTGFAIQTTQVPDAGNQRVATSWKAIKDTFPVNCAIANPVNPYNPDMKNEDAYLPYVPGNSSDAG